jgi:hypothetical protein
MSAFDGGSLLSPGTTTYSVVSFTPTQVGPASATLGIDDDGIPPALQIQLTGNGTDFDGGDDGGASSCQASTTAYWALPAYEDCCARCDATLITEGVQETFPDASVCDGAPLACACGGSGSVDYSLGCTQDSDCIVVGDDCCGCGWNAGSSTAILATNYVAFLSSFVHVWCENHACPYGPGDCDAGTWCRGGRCVLTFDAGEE